MATIDFYVGPKKKLSVPIKGLEVTECGAIEEGAESRKQLRVKVGKWAALKVRLLKLRYPTITYKAHFK